MWGSQTGWLKMRKRWGGKGNKKKKDRIEILNHVNTATWVTCGVQSLSDCWTWTFCVCCQLKSPTDTTSNSDSIKDRGLCYWQAKLQILSDRSSLSQGEICQVFYMQQPTYSRQQHTFQSNMKSSKLMNARTHTVHMDFLFEWRFCHF